MAALFNVSMSWESLLAEKTQSCIPTIFSGWRSAFLVCASCERWKPRGESNMNPKGLTCWQALDVSAHSFALRFTHIASGPVIKASVFVWSEPEMRRNSLVEIIMQSTLFLNIRLISHWNKKLIFFFFLHLSFYFLDYLMGEGGYEFAANYSFSHQVLVRWHHFWTQTHSCSKAQFWNSIFQLNHP